ncbi:MAG: sensor histidine kinase [Proteobacteria bacterium]|nr:sensor histidine kinase [Pseudomonadota bacterium]
MRELVTKRKKELISFLVFLIFLTLMLNTVADWIYKRGLIELKVQGNLRLELYINYLQGVLGKYESLPQLLAIDSNLVRTLSNPLEANRIETLNKYLETINRVSDALDTYLMNKDGLTIAASNWNEKHPFVGRNFSFRPYFKDAMRGKLGRYFAIGTTSSKRGYYFAYPVRKDDEILGAVVIKIDIDTIEQKWAHRDESFLVSDPDGVIFITTTPEWRYKTLRPLLPNVLKSIEENRRYPDASLTPLAEASSTYEEDVQILTIDEGKGTRKKRVMKQSQMMPHAGWDVHILSDTQELKTRALVVNILIALGLTVLFVIVLLLIQRKNRQAELDRIERESKKALREANELLETRVLERTLQLTETNELLRQEILDRKQTEVKLKRTRKELIHAAKLAVLGQMSAGINHELNQPLAAIRSYTDNGKQFLKKGRMDEAMWNLEQIGELTERMAQIGVQLKLFSKKSSGQIVAVPLHGVIDGALEILNPSLKKAGVVTNINISPENLEVRANNVLLQQVLVNLISNALQAMDGQKEKVIMIECIGVDERVVVAVEDNGPGVAEAHLQEIFEPFFTTKKSGQGLGLGLTISNRIIREFGGRLHLVRNMGGARFEFILERIQ